MRFHKLQQKEFGVLKQKPPKQIDGTRRPRRHFEKPLKHVKRHHEEEY